MTASLFLPPRFVSVDATGTPRAGSKWYFYEPGTSSAKTVYSDSGLTTPRTQPVVANAAGEVGAVYVDGDVKVSVYTSADVLLYTEDNIPAFESQQYPINTAETTAGLTEDDLDLSYIYGDLRRYGAASDGSDCSSAMTDALASNGTVTIPEGTWTFDSKITMGSANSLVGVRSDKSILKFTGATDGLYYANGFRQLHLRNLQLQTSSASGGKAIRIEQMSRGHIEDVQISVTGSGKWAFGIWGNNWQTSNIFGVRMYLSTVVGVHLEYGSNALHFYGMEIVGAATSERGVEMDATNSLSTGETLFEVQFYGLTIQGAFSKSALYAEGARPMVSGAHFENTDATPSDGADVWLDGGTTAIANAGFVNVQGGSFGTTGALRNFRIVGGEIGDVTIGASNVLASLINCRYGSLTDTGAQTTILGCCLSNGNNVPAKVQGTQFDVVISGTTRGVFSSAGLKVVGTAAAASSGELQIGSTTGTSASAGSNGDVPAQVAGYLIWYVGATAVRVPYYPAP